MRNLTTILIISILIAGLIGCEKYTSGYDTNPLAPQVANPSLTFAGAQMGYMEFTEGTCSWIGAIWADQVHGAQRQFGAYDVYTVNGQDFGNDWGLAYADALKNLQLVENNPASNRKVKGAAEILDGFHMGTVAAVWGDVPYSQSGQGEANPTPKYDSQQSVYTAVQAKLDAGITDLTNATASLTFQDIFSYGSNVSKWIKLGHSAKARYYMHMARGIGSVNAYDAATLGSVITEANLGITDPTGVDDLMFLHGTGAYNGDMNIWYSFGVWDRSGYMDAAGCFSVAMLQNRHWDGKTSEVKRLDFYYDPAYGYADLNYNDGAAFGATSSYPGFRASETLLLRAEAEQRIAGATVDASALADLNLARTYNNNVFGDTSTAYVAGDFANGAALLQAILNEEYLAVLSQIEAFNLVRRIDYQITYKDSAGTSHQLAPKNTSTNTFPYRFVYSVDEHNSNPNCPPEAHGLLDQFTRPWVDHQ
jgi:hypothetical protein